MFPCSDLETKVTTTFILWCSGFAGLFWTSTVRSAFVASGAVFPKARPEVVIRFRVKGLWFIGFRGLGFRVLGV